MDRKKDSGEWANDVLLYCPYHLRGLSILTPLTWLALISSEALSSFPFSSLPVYNYVRIYIFVHKKVMVKSVSRCFNLFRPLFLWLIYILISWSNKKEEYTDIPEMGVLLNGLQLIFFFWVVCTMMAVFPVSFYCFFSWDATWVEDKYLLVSRQWLILKGELI